ncbi:hypothetical protein CDL15_Pgr003545 [Punica granatum]|uniref:DUF7036 domain-containing protein n=1 Tax=Punica granatum TaxID=22663 RepID=A0A218X4S9_PUNGR|nr:hypothetical protein CDL15_Pgr003545 [Punica granatum]
MGKLDQQSNLRQPPGYRRDSQEPSRSFCWGCPVDLRRHLSLRCLLSLVLGLAIFLSAVFWILPSLSKNPGFDAKESVKLGAAVQASFKLEKPVAELVPRIGRLEYDIYGEIGAPGTKMAILSMHQAGSPNCTDVVFGVLSDPLDVPINQVSLIMLRSSLVELFLQLSNLTLTTSIFGQTSDFQILKFPGGVTVIPKQTASIWQIPQVLFNFSLNNSIYDIEENSVHFREQLKNGLHLKPHENVYVLVTNAEGSTLAPSVTVQASVMSDYGSLVPERLKELADIIKGSPVNLGLDNSEFGKVKSVMLSSYLNRTTQATSPSPSPAPSPGPYNELDPPNSAPSSHPLAPSPNSRLTPPCVNCEVSSPSPCIEPNVPVPSVPPAHPPQAHRSFGPRVAPRPSPSRPKRAVSPIFRPRSSGPTSPVWNGGNAGNLASPSLGPSCKCFTCNH